jgi:hypothetical protein
MLGAKEDDGLDTVNRYLEEGWKVKHISAFALGNNIFQGRRILLSGKFIACD